MTLLALTMTPHAGVRLAGGMTPFGKRMGQTIGGLGLTAGFVLLILATRWGHFH
jgi:hypothetical protein